MKRVIVLFSCLCGLMSLAATADSGTDPQKFWPQWRGPDATGVAPYGDPPVEWSEEKNVRFKVAIPGHGNATPVVWGNQIFLTTAIPTGDSVQPADPPAAPTGSRRGPRGVHPSKVLEFVLMVLDREDGSVLWQQTARRELPHEGTHPDGTWASNSPITDGEHVYAYFGSRGLYCYDMDGNLQWQRDLGDMTVKLGFGEGSSPAIYGDKLVILWDHEGESFLTALDKKTGKELWKVSREERTSWSTPLVVEHRGTAQVVTSATRRVRSYNLASGDLLWETPGMTMNAIPSPVAADGMVYLTSGFRGSSLMAIRLTDAKGDLGASRAIAWTHDRDTPYVPSPVLYDDTLYFVKSNAAILSSFNAKTGEANYGLQRLEGLRGVYASPVAASGRIYLIGRGGNALVVNHGTAFEVLALNSLDDEFDASPVIVGQELLLRGKNHLYAIAGD